MPYPDSFAELDDFYQQTLDYLYLKYHYQPDPLPQTRLSPELEAEMASFTRLAEDLAGGFPASGADRWQLNRDPRFSNGLPRRRLRR